MLWKESWCLLQDTFLRSEMANKRMTNPGYKNIFQIFITKNINNQQEWCFPPVYHFLMFAIARCKRNDTVLYFTCKCIIRKPSSFKKECSIFIPTAFLLMLLLQTPLFDGKWFSSSKSQQDIFVILQNKRIPSIQLGQFMAK